MDKDNVGEPWAQREEKLYRNMASLSQEASPSVQLMCGTLHIPVAVFTFSEEKQD